MKLNSYEKTHNKILHEDQKSYSTNQERNKMNPEDLMDGISNEIQSALKAMQKAKTAEEKLKHSKVIKNLCESLGVFLSLISSMPEDDDIPF